jgi:hypothetical protein
MGCHVNPDGTITCDDAEALMILDQALQAVAAGQQRTKQDVGDDMLKGEDTETVIRISKPHLEAWRKGVTP